MVDVWKDYEAPARPPGPPATKTRVLLADDHIVVRQGLARLLQSEPDFEVIALVASDGLMALEIARRERPDVVVMDVKMQGMGGIEATRLIRQELPNVRVIGLSMEHQRAVAEDMLRAGACAYLTKDCPAAELIEAIRGCKPASRR